MPVTLPFLDSSRQGEREEGKTVEATKTMEIEHKKQTLVFLSPVKMER